MQTYQGDSNIIMKLFLFEETCRKESDSGILASKHFAGAMAKAHPMMPI